MTVSQSQVRFSTTLAASLFITLLVTGCGKQNVTSLLNSVQAKAFTQNDEVWAEVSIDLNTQGFLLASFDLPINDPRNTDLKYGEVKMLPKICGSTAGCVNGGQLSVSINLTDVAHVKSASTALPNDTSFPLAFSSDVNLIAIPIGKAGAKLYVALNTTNSTAVIGAAIPFSVLDPAGKYTAGVNIFGAIPFGDVTGYVGMFAGSNTNQTGIAVFADISKVLANRPVLMNQSTALASSERLGRSASAPASTIQLKAPTHSQSAEKYFMKQMSKLNSKHHTLQYQ